MIEWTNLTSFLGESIQSPTDKQLKKALKELFRSRDTEHPDAWIECGSDNGPLHALSVFSSGYAVYTKYSDTDMSEELESKKIQNVTQESAFVLWKNLINNQQVIELTNTQETSKPWWKLW